jgi:hypothetical protein
VAQAETPTIIATPAIARNAVASALKILIISSTLDPSQSAPSQDQRTGTRGMGAEAAIEPLQAKENP